MKQRDDFKNKGYWLDPETKQKIYPDPNVLENL